MERKAEIQRKTKETDIAIRLILNDTSESRIDSGVPFFDHMLISMSRFSRIFLDLKCIGDNEIDDHHSIEDIGICLGKVFKKALGDKAGIRRFGSSILPMDDALTMVAVDLSGRSYFKVTGYDFSGTINQYSEELTHEFLNAFSVNAGMNLHIKVFYGENRHHINEAIFKALGIAIFNAYSIDYTINGEIPSTKGVIV